MKTERKDMHKKNANKKEKNSIKKMKKIKQERNTANNTVKPVQPKIPIQDLSPKCRYGRLRTVLSYHSYKIVYRGVDLDKGIEIEWNSIKLDTFVKQSYFFTKFDFIASINHPNIKRMHDFWFVDGSLVFISEFMTSGTLREYIKKLEEPNPKIIRKWAKQILEGLKYLHNYNPPLIHGNINCENIYINGFNGEIKIGNIGLVNKDLSVSIDEGMRNDVLLFGLALIEMSIGEFTILQPESNYRKILENCLLVCISYRCLRELVYKCIKSSIINVDEILNHHFFDPDNMCMGQCCTENTSNYTFNPQLDIQDLNGELIAFKGSKNDCVFEFIYNLKNDIIEGVVNEMIEEGIIEKNNMK
ncbi:Serine/threonine-protein kinase pkpA [Astathelohania contejeani]|uniref:Serine/threonine-protein kinase pkpA n=1 Tax=Astathelohania contejeani TaxID=164912 RepID=A0ABQ7I0N0_9MICR|nr:Serine/threonine-protein kinase pkpA [Thelohania contejeani]